MTILRRLLVALLLVIAGRVPLGAQAPAAPAPPPAAPPGTPAQTAPAAPTPPPNFTYEADGRRDPFVALISRGQQRGTTRLEVRAEGVAGIGTDELAVRGIIQSRGTWVAMVSGPSGKVYTVRAGDRLADGTIRSITAQAVVVLQQVNDPLSLEKQREVRKFLRGGENK